MSRVVKTLFASVFSLVIWLPVALAQEAQDPGTTPSPTKKLDKETKRKMKRTLKELDNAYRQWLTEDVTYIISPEERNAFLQLDTNEEREQFIERRVWGQYHRARDTSKKSAVLQGRGEGLSLLESMGMSKRAGGCTRPDGTTLPKSRGGHPASMDESNRLELYAKVNKPPEVK